MTNVIPMNSAYMTCDSFQTSWFEDFVKFVDASAETLRTYKSALKQFAIYLQKNGITAPTREDVLNFKASLKESHESATVQLYIVAVRQFFKWTALKGFYANVADNIKGAKVSRNHKRDNLTSSQVRMILDNMDADTVAQRRDYAIFSLMVTTGLRTIEVSRADLQDLRTLGEYTVLYIQGKGREDKGEFVKITPEVEKAIRDYLAVAGHSEASEPLFTSISNNSTGKRLSTRSIRGIVKTELVKNGYTSKRLTAHSLRHTTATINLENGGTLEETQQLLRHCNINTTMIYNHNLKRLNNNSESRVASAIFNQKYVQYV